MGCGVVGRELEVLIHVGGLTVHFGRERAIVIVQYCNIQKWYNMSLFSLRSELDVLVGVDVGSTWSAGTTIRTSSTYLFQKYGRDW